MKFITIVLLMLIFCANGFGQKLLFHKNKNKYVFYEVNDIISFRLKGDKEKITRQIIGFNDSLIFFQNLMVNPRAISHMYVDRKTRNWYPLRYKYKKIFPVLGIGYLLLDVLNTQQLNKTTLIISGSLVAAGILSKFLISEKIKIKKRRKLLIVD
jgi:hypothetical protein